MGLVSLHGYFATAYDVRHGNNTAGTVTITVNKIELANIPTRFVPLISSSVNAFK